MANLYLTNHMPKLI